MKKLPVAVQNLSPVRSSTQAASVDALAREQLTHFGIEPDSEFGKALYSVSEAIYHTGAGINHLEMLCDSLNKLPEADKVSRFNAKKFLCFQLAKLIDMLQPGMKATYNALDISVSSRAVKGDYPLFANVGALFSATPAVVKTATYLYACTEWVQDAFTGRESTHPIYSRLLNPTSIALANTVTALEAGEYASEYMTWNFNSGMAAIDALLANQLKHGDILLASRNVYGGTFQLMQDFYARKNRMDVQLEWFDGFTGEAFEQTLKAVEKKYQKRLKDGKNLLVYLESPCNPHGNMLDVPAICQLSHDNGYLVALDSTLATPFLSRPLRQKEKSKRPDWVIHSYTKDISGSGTATAGGIIGENKRMFLPKHSDHDGISWEDTLFWDVYYIKGAFLDADKALDVMNGLKTLEARMLTKCINTLVFSRYLNSHPLITVNSHALEEHHNSTLREELLYLGLPSPLFSIDMEKAGLPRDAFVRFFDSLEPAFGHMVSLGQSNTLILCPALTSHSELDETAQKDAGIYLTTIRIAMGDENPVDLIQHFKACTSQFIDPVLSGFSGQFISDQQLEKLYQETYTDIHQKHVKQG